MSDHDAYFEHRQTESEALRRVELEAPKIDQAFLDYIEALKRTAEHLSGASSIPNERGKRNA